MPTSPHEALHRIFQEDTSLFARAIHRALDISFPDPIKVTTLNADLTELLPIERQVDTLLMAADEDGSHIVLIEAQCSKKTEKLAAWPYYIAYAHAKYSCPVTLLVICHDRATARWAREPIYIGIPGAPCMVIYPLVLGPDNVPRITDPDEAAEDIHLAILSALVHHRDPEPDAILEAVVEGLDRIDVSTAMDLADFTEAGLGDTRAGEIWRALMSAAPFDYVSETKAKGIEIGRAEGLAEGLAKGEARSVLRILTVRGIEITDSARERILTCTDEATLVRWLDLAITATTVDELFA